MARKEPPAEAGAPLWMCTYGDLMSLLLCFFIMLFAISSIIDAKWEALVETFNARLGYTGPSPTPSYTTRPATAMFSASERARRTATLTGQQPTPGKGESQNVQTISTTGDIVKGGLIRFELGSDELNAQAKSDLEALFPKLLISSQKIMIKGHAAPTEDTIGIYKRDIDLAHARAVNVRDYLVSLGLKKEFFQIGVSDSSTPPHRDILPLSLRRDPKLAGASVAVYLLGDTVRPRTENHELVTPPQP